ncbi:hypothetical protein L6452_41672 [Arctium lappa]|uniref:Uncharacterized protein n=1 Tax=Arctium lappa TaxID=4217 RepID=A0ACB8XQ85_ARCLA|nr:hypothetical protein L6452_41672 [Arctium lappa]
MGSEPNNSPCELPSTTTTTAGITRRKHRYPVEETGPESNSHVGCSGKSCRSCTAGVIADCVAVCCCPCAVVNFFTLTFLKLPWMMGRKCLGLGNKKKKKLKNDDNTEKDRSGISRKDEGVERKSQNLEEEEKEEYSARFEAEKVWLELYKIDQLGFGRVSFTGIQSLE